MGIQASNLGSLRARPVGLDFERLLEGIAASTQGTKATDISSKTLNRCALRKHAYIHTTYATHTGAYVSLVFLDKYIVDHAYIQ